MIVLGKEREMMKFYNKFNMLEKDVKYTFLVITSQTLKISFDFLKNGVQIQIPRQKVYFC